MQASDIIAEGYQWPSVLPSGEWAALMPMLFTTALIVGIDQFGYRTRYCYEHASDAMQALQNWDGTSQPPGPWIKQKPEEILGPGALT